MASSAAADAPAKSFLRGRAFYESIGSPKFVVAPMVDQSEFAWRMLTRSFLTPEENSKTLAYTPMFHARLFEEVAKYRDSHLQTAVTKDNEPVLPTTPETASETSAYLDGNPAFDRPLFVQFCANDPDHLLAAAKLAAPYCDAVDLNLGCPQGIARKGHYGAFLQEDQELVHKLVNTLHDNLSIPVTAKIRILDNKENTLKYAQNVLSAGASIITVHGRRREQKGHLTGVADWEYLRYLRENLPPETVIFANGNVLEHGDLERCLEATGADAVMSAEGNLSNPALFAKPPPPGQERREYWRGRCGEGGREIGGFRVDAVFRRYMDILHKHVLGREPPARRPLFIVGDDETWLEEKAAPDAEEEEGPAKKKRKTDNKSGNNNNSNSKKPEKVTSPNLVAVRPHLFHLLRHFIALHTDIRDALARCRAGDIDAVEAVLDMVERRIARGLIDYEKSGGESIREYMESTAKPPKAGGDAGDGRGSEGKEGKKNKNKSNGAQTEWVQEGPASQPQQNGTTTTPAAAAPNTNSNNNNPDQPQQQQQQQQAQEQAPTESSLATVKACKRPWWVCQPIVRPLPAEALAKGSIQLSKKQQKVLQGLNGSGSGSAVGVTAAAATAAVNEVTTITATTTTPATNGTNGTNGLTGTESSGGSESLPRPDGKEGIKEPVMDHKQQGLVSDELICG